ncbi:MAG: type II toxin-antitoxin system death-on-curing family toxin [Chthoniobacteraceae bacterium]
MSAPFTHLTASAVRAIHEEVLAAHGGLPGIRDEGLLESAVAAPEATMMGEPLITDPVEVAAAYLFYICRNHAFLDGNKRTTLAACLVFLDANGLLPREKLPTDEWESLVLDVAGSHLDRDQTTARLRQLLKQLSRKKKERAPQFVRKLWKRPAAFRVILPTKIHFDGTE